MKKNAIPEAPETVATEMGKMSISMLKVSVVEFQGYEDELKAIRQGLEAANRAFNAISLKEITNQ